jgi:hypothetical protein
MAQLGHPSQICSEIVDPLDEDGINLQVLVHDKI